MQAQVSSQQGFMGASGGWAHERFREHGLRAAALRSYDTLPRDVWEEWIAQVVMEAQIRLRAVQDLVSGGLTRPIENAMGKTMIRFHRVSDIQAATRSMDGVTRGLADRPDYISSLIPNHITHADFFFSLRELQASRNEGESLDTTQLRDAGRRVAESLEDALFNGAGVVVDGNQAAGYTTHGDRNTASFGTNGSWDQAAKTGENILDDVLTLIAAAETDRYYGPFAIYAPADAASNLRSDFKANSDKPTMQRLMEIDSIRTVQIVDQLASANVVLVQLTSDVVEMADGEGIQPVQWDSHGGFQTNFKVMAIQVPIVKSTHSGRSGVVHMS